MAHKGSYHRPKAGDRDKPPRPVAGPKVLTGAKPKKYRPLDRIAGEGSTAGKLKKHRDELEKGNPRGSHPKPGRRK